MACDVGTATAQQRSRMGLFLHLSLLPSSSKLSMALPGIPGLFPSPWAPPAPSGAQDAGDGRGTSAQLVAGGSGVG